MTPLQFLTALWPDAGIYCIATPYKVGGGKMRHTTFTSLAEAAEYASTRATDTFFCVHALKQAEVWNPRHHKDDETGDWVGGMSVRLQVNMRAARTFFFDLDVEPGKETKYPTQRAAVEGLQEFLQATGLPTPMIVSSGGGLHVYWRFTEELLSQVHWTEYASKLKQLAQHYGLKADPARTTDTASVLRVAGTFNHKRGEKRPVRVMKQGDVVETSQLRAIIDAAIVGAGLTPRETTLDAQLGSNIQREFEGPKLTAIDLFKSCAQMARMARAQGNLSEPEWYAGLSQIVELQDGDNLIHVFSRGHAGYSPADTIAKADRARIGPVPCEKMRDVSEGHRAICDACPFWGKVKGPLAAARIKQEAEPPVVEELIDGIVHERVIPNPPPPYKRGVKGGIEMLTENNKGEQYTKTIYEYDLYPIIRSANRVLGIETSTWRVHLPHAEPHDFVITASELVDPKALQVKLANQGIYVHGQFDVVKQYMSAYIKELQRSQATSLQMTHLGWTQDKQGFILPGKMLKADGTSEQVQLGGDADGAENYVCKAGTLKEQVRLLNFFNDKRYIANQAYILAALASPLLFATGQHGIVLNATGEPGASKSTALYTAAGFWGRPTKYALSATAGGATQMYRDQRMSALSNLPLCADEITHTNAEVAKQMVMNATQPGERLRVGSDGKPKKQQEADRSSVVMLTSNRPLNSLISLDNAAGTAGAVRVFEIRFQKRGVHEKWQADEYLRGINGNYGHVGEEFSKVLVQLMPPLVQKVHETSKRIERLANAREEERFWFALVAAIIVAGHLAKRMGLISWDIDAIEHWLLHVQLPEMRATVNDEVEAQTPLAILTDYIEHINGDMIKIAKTLGNTTIPNIIQRPRGPMYAHYDVEKGYLWVLRSAFKDWCDRKNIDSRATVNSLFTTHVITNPLVWRTLGLGTELSKGRSKVFVVNMQHAELKDVDLTPVAGGAPSVAVEGEPDADLPKRAKPDLKVVK